MRFNKLDVPYQWRDEFTKYPHGYTIFEALCKWTGQVDEMVVNLNSVNDYMVNFSKKFDKELANEIITTLTEWQNSGFLEVVISQALQTQINVVEEELDRKVNWSTHISDYKHLVGNQSNPDEKLWDWTNAIDEAIANTEAGGTVFFSPGTYMRSTPIILDKAITLKGYNSGGKDVSTIIKFYKCHGIIPRATYITIEGLHIIGVGNEPGVNPSLNQFGRVGILAEMDTDMNSGGLVTRDVRIEGFNTGVLMRKGPGSTWAGAYRDFYSLRVHYNDIGIAAIDGATHNKVMGGVVSANTTHGLYTNASTQYNNIELIGVTMELNGYQGGSFIGKDYGKYGLYVGKESQVKATNCYFEKMNGFAVDGGYIYLNGCHIHSSTGWFTKGLGSITENGSFGPIKTIYSVGDGDDYIDKMTYGNLTTTNKGAYVAGVNVTSTAKQSIISMTSKWEHTNIGSLLVKDINWVKFTCKVKVNSGRGATGFGVRPFLSFSTEEGSEDAINLDLVLPLEIYEYNIGVEEKIEFFYMLRKGEGVLNNNHRLKRFKTGLRFFVSSSTVDYTSQNLDADVSELTVEFYSKSPVTILS